MRCAAERQEEGKKEGRNYKKGAMIRIQRVEKEREEKRGKEASGIVGRRGEECGGEGGGRVEGTDRGAQQTADRQTEQDRTDIHTNSIVIETVHALCKTK